jgi:protocatechuate 3,4-dioxygenase beta subunit
MADRIKLVLSRRDVLGVIVGAGGAIVLSCGDNLAGPKDAARDGASATGGDAGSASCAETPEGEVGPYFADDSADGFNRSNILSNLDGSSTQVGVPLTLSITVLDSEKGCTPYAGAQIDIWHCNAAGVYSDIAGEGTSTEQWLRGYQLTDTNGQVTFTTIVPGWYAGRTTHIHLRLRTSYDEGSATDDGTNTTQCFFDQTFVDTLDTTVAPYSAEGQNPTTNAGDRVYAQQENGANQLVLAGDTTTGYTTSITIYVPIASAANGSGMGPPPGDGGMIGPPPLDAS